MEEKIKKVLETVRPHLQRDGGDVEFVSYEDGVVKVRLKGACSGCPMSQMTIKGFVEGEIRKEVPEIKGVVSVE